MASGEIHQDYLNKAWIFIIPFSILVFLIALLNQVDLPFLYPIFICFNYWLCDFIDPDNDLMGMTQSEGRILRLSKKYWIGFLGALFVSYSFIYAYIVGLFGGHRSWLSHGWIIGTLFRMFFYNIPLFFSLWVFYSYGISNWQWRTDVPLKYIFYMDRWVMPYLSMQFLAWFISDGIHLILDTSWAKGVLYTPASSKRD
jgi:hypothetical protein